MNQYQIRARSLLFLICALLSVREEAAAQPFRLHCDGVSAIGGVFSAATGRMLAVGGQPHPLRFSSSANHVLYPGFISCITRRGACTGLAAASLDCPAAPEAGGQIQVPLFIDMSGVSAPNHLLGSFTGSLSWNPALLRYVSHSGLQSGFTGAVNAANAAAGILEFNGANALGSGGIVPVLGVTFDVIGASSASGTFGLSYTNMASAATFVNLLPCLTVNDCPFVIRPASPCLVCGDVNDDGAAGSSDALIILSYDVGIPIPPDLLDKINAGCGDVNSDGATGSSDALIILSYDAGLSVPFPVGNPGGCGTTSGQLHAPAPKAIAPQASVKRNEN